jgi:hypothetical protein
MELLVGVDLRAHLSKSRTLPLQRTLAIAVPLAAGLAHAHDAGVIHRDLKPGNVLLAEQAGVVVPKIVDFGLSKAILGQDASPLTEVDGVAGTASYMAPEQTLGVRNASPASDQYSLAVIVYEAITGRTPFTADETVALLERIRTESIPPPSRLHSSLPRTLDDVLLRALARDPAARFPSVAAFGAALLPFADPALAADLARSLGQHPSSSRARALTRASSGKTTAAADARADRSPSSMKIAPVSKTAAQNPASKWDAPLPCPAGESPFHIKGMAYRGMVRFIEKAVPGGIDGFCESLSDTSLRDFLHQPFLASTRYDILPFVPLSAALGRILGVPPDLLVRRAAASQCQYDSQTVFKAIFSDQDPNAIAECFARFNAQYYDFGKYKGTVVEPFRIELESREIPAYAVIWFEPMHLAYSEEVARIVGAREVRGTFGRLEQCGRLGRFPLVKGMSEIVWKV